jgi:hypothetical protein
LGVHNRQTSGSEDGGEINSAFTSSPIPFLAATLASPPPPLLFPVAMLPVHFSGSKAYVWGSSLTGIVDSNPAGDMFVSCKCCVLSGSLRRADHSSERVLASVVCLSVISKPRQ